MEFFSEWFSPGLRRGADARGGGSFQKKNTKRGFFHHKFTNPTVGGRRWVWNQRSFYLQRSRWPRSWGVGSLPVILKWILQRRAFHKSWLAKCQKKNNHDGCLFFVYFKLDTFSSTLTSKLWWLLPLPRKLAFICFARRNSRTIVVADLKKNAVTHHIKPDWEAWLETSKEYAFLFICQEMIQYSGVSQVQEEWWRPRGVKGCFSIETALYICYAAMPCCIMSSVPSSCCIFQAMGPQKKVMRNELGEEVTWCNKRQLARNSALAGFGGFDSFGGLWMVFGWLV